MKKMFSGILIFIMIFSLSFSAFAYKAYPSGDGKIILKGEKNPDRATTMMVTENGKSQIVSIGQTPKGKGDFSYTLPIGTADELDYSVVINADTVLTVKNTSSTKALDELNEASADEIADVAELYHIIFDFDISKLDAIYDKAAAYKALADKNFTSVDNASGEYLESISDVINNEKLAALKLIEQEKADEAVLKYIGHFDVDMDEFNAVKTKTHVYNFLNGNTYTEAEFADAFSDAIIMANINDASGETFRNIVRSNQEKIGLDLSEDSGIADVVFKKADGRICRDFTALKTVFMQEIALNKLNTADKKDVKSVLEEENAVLGILDADGYSSLTDNQKSEVCQAMAGGNFASVEAARTEFEQIVDRIANPAVPNPPQNSSRPSSGGGVSISGGSTSSSAGGTVSNTTAINLPFTDIASEHWGYDSVCSLYSQKIISGTSETTFEPDRQVTREEFIKMLVGTFGLFNVSAKNVFSDVPDDHWAVKFIASAYEKGLTYGKDNGSFGLGETLTRQDMATLASRCADIARLNLSENDSVRFDDEYSFASYAVDSIYRLAAAGIINGTGNGLFSPNASCTRAMAAKVCNELLNFYEGGVIR